MFLPVDSLVEAVDALNAGRRGERSSPSQPVVAYRPTSRSEPEPDFADVVGQGMAKRALEIAAAGGHNALLIGAPGGGKTMMARRLAGYSPAARVRRGARLHRRFIRSRDVAARDGADAARPFPRAPSHDFGSRAWSAEGRCHDPARSAWLTMACCSSTSCRNSTGACSRRSGNLSKKAVSPSHAWRGQRHFPARFMLVAAMNPCPCGFHGDQRRACRCSEPQIERYAGRISGPLRDRIDLVVEVPAASEQIRCGCRSMRSLRRRFASACSTRGSASASIWRNGRQAEQAARGRRTA